ncbi:carboxypeptidase regulatory-like domain-containing protein [Acinetobacter venetianus]|uniref:carboxypeptidase regulatory-like domain-containing protein n=1 Tax=Acinetobacter venetianus TaxID=52133 RepID=UPI003A8F0DD0
MRISIHCSYEKFTASPYRDRNALYIKGTLEKQGIPTQGFVSLHERISGVLVDRAKADINGNYRFNNISNKFKYFVYAHDINNQFNAVIQDNVVPK